MYQLWALIFFTSLICSKVNNIGAKLCEEITVRNNIAALENSLRGCQVVVGHLKILLMEHTRPPDFQNVSFPELTEIKGFLLIYRIRGLTSLGKLFPNLVVIRGLKLLTDYSLVLYDLPHLQEIGLVSLKYIARGSTRIEKCNNLCYVNTIDWTRITSSKHRIEMYDSNAICEKCPTDCNGYCWNQELCQIKDEGSCDPQCIGCTGPGADKCLACRIFKDNQRCVSHCPPNKYPHPELATCVTEYECSTLLNGTWCVSQDQCVKHCPSGYQNATKKKEVKCDGKAVENLADTQDLRGCTHLLGSLIIKVDSKSTADELEEALQSIQEIDGFLKISRSHPLTSLGFLKNLKIIHGNELEYRRYALVVYENQNLQKLWNWENSTLAINNGSISFHYNPRLCMSEIDTLAKKAGVSKNYTTVDVSPFSNGDKTTCNFVELHVTMVQISSTNVTLAWNEYTVTKYNSVLIGYLLYYIPDPLGNLTIYDENDECDESGWDSIFVSNNSQMLVNLIPHTQYSYYIKVYTSTPAANGQTEIARFVTLADDPSVPVAVRAISFTSESVTLFWEPPLSPNGILSHYVIFAYYQSDDPDMIAERNYCNHPHLLHPEDVTNIPTDIWSNSTSNTTCCKNQNKYTVETFDALCDELEVRVMGDYKTNSCKNYMYSVDNSTNGHTNTTTEFLEKLNHNIVKKANFPFDTVIEKVISGGNLTSYEFKELKHYSLYVFLLKACNSIKQCSAPVMISNRTLKKENADDIPAGFFINVHNLDVTVKWEEPNEPNSVIVAYQVEHKRADLENSKTLIECITRQQYLNDEHGYTMKNFLPGQYTIRIKAVSLAGIGRFTESIEFIISLSSHGIPPVAYIVPLIILLLIVFAALYGYHFYYKRKHKFDQLHLITTVNPDYAGPIYIEDDWEIDREDIDVSKELGQGTFGMVYNGFIKSRKLPCAVKTVFENTNVHDRMVFLNEASIMKSFSDAHHVVKLLGVVSRGDPPYVVMELMVRGDLKSFLRRSRDSSNTITCVEMYRMAAEIADGMMYLSAKKFVHRDLAARNCMVGADFTVKIGDFGMTRDIYETDYYRKETRGLMPARWMPPESLADGVFTSDSDVWSYGVVLWEMATLAEQPYQGLTNEQVLQFVIAQGTLERPSECPDLLYEIMEACWKWRPSHRPLFKDIVEKLEPHIGQNFRLVSFYHSAEGEEYRVHAKNRVYNPPALSALDRNTGIRWNASDDDDVSLYSMESNRPTPLLSSIPNQSIPSSSSYR